MSHCSPVYSKPPEGALLNERTAGRGTRGSHVTAAVLLERTRRFRATRQATSTAPEVKQGVRGAT